jgi:hypothetical protein
VFTIFTMKVVLLFILEYQKRANSILQVLLIVLKDSSWSICRILRRNRKTGGSFKKVKKSRKTKYNDTAQKYFQWHYIRKWMRRLFELKIVKSTDVKEITSFTSLQEEKIVFRLLINIIYVKTQAISNKSSLFSI